MMPPGMYRVAVVIVLCLLILGLGMTLYIVVEYIRLWRGHRELNRRFAEDLQKYRDEHPRRRP